MRQDAFLAALENCGEGEITKCKVGLYTFSMNMMLANATTHLMGRVNLWTIFRIWGVSELESCSDGNFLLCLPPQPAGGELLKTSLLNKLRSWHYITTHASPDPYQSFLAWRILLLTSQTFCLCCPRSFAQDFAKAFFIRYYNWFSFGDPKTS